MTDYEDFKCRICGEQFWDNQSTVNHWHDAHGVNQDGRAYVEEFDQLATEFVKDDSHLHHHLKGHYSFITSLFNTWLVADAENKVHMFDIMSNVIDDHKTLKKGLEVRG